MHSYNRYQYKDTIYWFWHTQTCQATNHCQCKNNTSSGAIVQPTITKTKTIITGSGTLIETTVTKKTIPLLAHSYNQILYYLEISGFDIRPNRIFGCWAAIRPNICSGRNVVPSLIYKFMHCTIFSLLCYLTVNLAACSTTAMPCWLVYQRRKCKNYVKYIKLTASAEYTGMCCLQNESTRSYHYSTHQAILAANSNTYHVQNCHTCLHEQTYTPTVIPYWYYGALQTFARTQICLTHSLLNEPVFTTENAWHSFCYYNWEWFTRLY